MTGALCGAGVVWFSDKKRKNNRFAQKRRIIMALTNEDLLAFSQLLDVKLKPLENRMQRIEDKVQRIEDRVQRIETELAENIKPRLVAIESRLQFVENRLQCVENKLQRVEDRVQCVEEKVQQIETELTENIKPRLTAMESRLQYIEVDLLENNVVPRLNTIESCYMDTYDRYRNYTEKMDATFVDTELLKKVVSEHSEQLQKLA